MMHLLYALIASISSILGGLLPIYTKLKFRTNNLIGFAAGVLISTALFEMLPESAGKTPNFALPLALGFFFLYLIEKVAMVHACKEMGCEVHHIGWVSMIGLGLESVLDGIAIGVGYATAPALGLFIAIAVIVHEFPVGFSTSVIMMSSNYRQKSTLIALVATSLLTVVGAAAYVFFPLNLFASVLAFTAGTFLYIGASDLLPEAHKKADWLTIVSVLAGAALMPAIELAMG